MIQDDTRQYNSYQAPEPGSDEGPVFQDTASDRAAENKSRAVL